MSVEESILTYVKGVDKMNRGFWADGSRQKLVRALDNGDRLVLTREKENRFDKNAIAVFTMSKKQIGYVSRFVAEKLAPIIDKGYPAAAFVKSIKWEDEIYQCLMEIRADGFVWTEDREPVPADIANKEKENKAKEFLEEAKHIEESDPETAIELYKNVFDMLKEVDLLYKSIGSKYDMKRYTRFPVNKLSSLYERIGKFEESMNVIKQYESMEDNCGLTKTDIKKIEERKKALRTKI